MSRKINYDREMFNKVLLKIKTLLKQGDLEVIPEFELEEPKDADSCSRFIELYNRKIRISIEMSVNICDEEVWQIDIISMADGRLKYRGISTIDGNDIAADLYNRIWLAMEKHKQTIDEYVDDLFD